MPPSLYQGSPELASSLRFVRPTIDVQSFGGDGGGGDGGNDGGTFGDGGCGGEQRLAQWFPRHSHGASACA